MTTMQQRLYINIDHVATIRQARRGDEPVPAEAVSVCERAGADGITAHLREDRRHMNDADIDAIAVAVTTVFNLEIAGTDEMIALAERLKPYQVTIVPERREEVTTEGGLNVSADPAKLAGKLERLRAAGIRTSLFIDPDIASVQRSHETRLRVVHPPEQLPEGHDRIIAWRDRSECRVPVDVGQDLPTLIVEPEEARCAVESDRLEVEQQGVNRARPGADRSRR